MRKKILNLFFFLCGFTINRVVDDTKGTIIILIDGLSFDSLQLALEKGYCPTIKKLRTNGYILDRYYCGLPAATTSTEALLFYGNNFNIPGFTWYDRTLGTFVRGNRSSELSEFEDQFGKKRNLLDKGSSIMSVYTGGATELSVSGRYLTFSRSLYFIKTAHYFLMALLYPIQLVRTLYLTVKTIIFFNKAKWHSAKETFSKITLGQFSCFLTEIEIMRNTQKIFIDFLLYDEFAHEYGPVNKATLSTLRLIDRYINRIITSAQKAKRDYDIIILSDHGQTESIPFDQKTNRIIRDIAHALDNDTYSITKTYGGFVPTGDTKEVYVVPAGSTLQLYFSDYLKTGVFEHEIVHRFPQIIKKLLALEEFGWVLVKIDNTTSRLYGKQGTVLLKSNNASLSEGHPFPQLTQDEIEKTIASFGYYSTFPNNGDIVLFGNITSQKKVYSFENHKGTHGGFYGPMVYPFILSTKKYDNVNSMESLFNSIWRGMEA